jgi:hypothetical protein
MYHQIISDGPMTNNAVEAWNGQWNAGADSNAGKHFWSVIRGFIREESLARQKYWQNLQKD